MRAAGAAEISRQSDWLLPDRNRNAQSGGAPLGFFRSQRSRPASRRNGQGSGLAGFSAQERGTRSTVAPGIENHRSRQVLAAAIRRPLSAAEHKVHWGQESWEGWMAG